MLIQYGMYNNPRAYCKYCMLECTEYDKVECRVMHTRRLHV